MHEFTQLGIHVSHACNLQCESCDHYSNQGHSYMPLVDEAEAWMKLWNSRLQPRQFELYGGEPALHPRLTEFFVMAANNWPNTKVRVVSNGFLLHRHPGLPEMIGRYKGALHISIHHDSPEYREAFRSVERLVHRWQEHYDIAVCWRPAYRNWTRRVRGFGAEMRPFTDADPRRSWEACPSKHCRQLWQGMIWKCPELAYLRPQAEKYGLHKHFAPYLSYRPLEPNCTDGELDAWFEKTVEPECAMCPARPEAFPKPYPLPKAIRPAQPAPSSGRATSCSSGHTKPRGCTSGTADNTPAPLLAEQIQ